MVAKDTGEVQLKVASVETVAFDLMMVIHGHSAPAKAPTGPEYWLKLYRECLDAVGLHDSRRGNRERGIDPDTLHQMHQREQAFKHIQDTGQHVNRTAEARARAIEQMQQSGREFEKGQIEAGLPAPEIGHVADRALQFVKDHPELSKKQFNLKEWETGQQGHVVEKGRVFVEPSVDVEKKEFSISIKVEVSF
jgi:hypothetical protein